MMRPKPAIAPFLALSLALPAAAQDLSSPHEAVTQPRTDQPLAAIVAATPDEDIVLLTRYLTGSFTSQPKPDRPALILRSAPITIDGLADTILFELTRADSPADPFRLYIMHPYRRQGVLRLRTFELPAVNGLKDALASLVTTPSSLPKLDAATLTPSLDMPVETIAAREKPTSFRARTERPIPINRAGAIEMTASINATPGTLELADAGFNADGKRLWGGVGSQNDAPDTFSRSESQPLISREDNLIAITTIAPQSSATKLLPGGQATLHYTSWLTTGQLVETSRSPGKPPTIVNIPGNLLPGLNRGLLSIAPGERRKLIISPALAYGPDGRGLIPPNATLIFDVECLHIDNDAHSTPNAPTRMFNPHAAPPGAAAPIPINPSAPIGSPPTNGAPESPRGGPH